MAYEFLNSNESPKYTVVDILGRFFFSPDIQDRNLRTNHPTGLFHGHHLIPTNLFTKSEFFLAKVDYTRIFPSRLINELGLAASNY